jgi:hypothetical protein
MKTILQFINRLSEKNAVSCESNENFAIDYSRFNGFISVP